MALVLNKFLIKGGLGFKAVSGANLLRGPIRHAPYRDDILDELKVGMLEHHEISGVSEGGFNVRKSAEESMRFFAINNVLTGPLLAAFERLTRRLRLE